MLDEDVPLLHKSGTFTYFLKPNTNDLVSAGFTPSANNTAESLLLAIVLKMKAVLTDAARDSNIDQSVAVTDGYSPSITIQFISGIPSP